MRELSSSRFACSAVTLLILSACHAEGTSDSPQDLRDTADGSLAGQMAPVDRSHADSGIASDAGVPDAEPAAPPDGPGTDAPASSRYLFQIVDDFDDLGAKNPGWICSIGLCSWFCGPTGTGVAGVETPMPARGNSKGAWHLRSQASSPGVEVKLDIHAPGFPAVLYPNLEKYVGVAFWARSDLEDQTLLLAVEDDKVIATSYEVASRSNPWFTRPVELSSRWRRYIIPFEDLRQVDATGTVRPATKLNTRAVWSFHFLAGLDGKRSDVWIDDLALLCRGPCPPPAYDLEASATGDADPELQWTRSVTIDPDFACAELAELSTLPFDQWIAGPGEKVFLRARIPAAPSTPVPLWGWSVEKLPGGTLVPVEVIDPDSSVVAIPVSSPGEYRVRAHTHYPGNQTCGVELTATAAAR